MYDVCAGRGEGVPQKQMRVLISCVSVTVTRGGRGQKIQKFNDVTVQFWIFSSQCRFVIWSWINGLIGPEFEHPLDFCSPLCSRLFSFCFFKVAAFRKGMALPSFLPLQMSRGSRREKWGMRNFAIWNWNSNTILHPIIKRLLVSCQHILSSSQS